MKYIPYSTLKQNSTAYQIMLRHDQSGISFSDMAKEFNKSQSWVTQTYSRQKIKQINLYINHIALVLGHADNREIRNLYFKINDFYWDHAYSCAYLEVKYKDILDEYRNGEPGAPKWFLKTMPPYKEKLSKSTVAKVIEMREKQKASFKKIGFLLQLTPDKARHIYRLSLKHPSNG